MGEAAHEFAMDAAGADAPALAAATEAAAPTAEGGVVAPTAGGDVGTEITLVVREGRGVPLFTVKTPTSRKLDEVVEEKLQQDPHKRVDTAKYRLVAGSGRNLVASRKSDTVGEWLARVAAKGTGPVGGEFRCRLDWTSTPEARRARYASPPRKRKERETAERRAKRGRLGVVATGQAPVPQAAEGAAAAASTEEAAGAAEGAAAAVVRLIDAHGTCRMKTNDAFFAFCVSLVLH